MIMTEKEKLMNEYVQKYNYTFRFLEISGYCRFIIRNGKIVERTPASVVYNVFIMIMIDISAAVMLWTANLSEETLSTVEFGAIMHFAIFSNLLLCHITFVNKHRGPILIHNCIELDCYLDVKETEFMRNKTFLLYKYIVILTLILQIALVGQMYYLFDVSIIIHIFGSLYFFWIFFAYNDLCFLLYLYWFLTTRVRYLNVALMKITNMNMEYMPKQWLFNILFWDNKCDDLVSFHIRNKNFTIAFKILFQQLEDLQLSGRFPFILGFSTVVMGSFMTVQTFIMYIEASVRLFYTISLLTGTYCTTLLFNTSATAIARASVITCWVIASWFFLLIITTFQDMFYTQIEQTKLICSYIQLKATSSAAMLKLTKDVITTLELKEPRLSLYNIFILDTGLVLKLAASTFVYITVQLQLAFPNLEERYKVGNLSKPTMYEIDHNTVKEFLFLY